MYIKQNYVDVFFLNVTVSEFYLICFCATYRISKSEEVLSLGPDTLITKPKKGGHPHHANVPRCIWSKLVDSKTEIVCWDTEENSGIEPI